MLLGAAMKQADVRIDPLHEAQDAVSPRMRGAEIDREITWRRFRHGGRDDYTGGSSILEPTQSSTH